MGVNGTAVEDVVAGQQNDTAVNNSEVVNVTMNETAATQLEETVNQTEQGNVESEIEDNTSIVIPQNESAVNDTISATPPDAKAVVENATAENATVQNVTAENAT